MTPTGQAFLKGGQTSTGVGAAILPRSRLTALDVHLANMDDLDAYRKEKKAENEKAKEKMNKMLEDLDVDMAGVLDKDVPELSKKKGYLTDFYAESYSKGMDPDDPVFLDNYKEARKIQTELQGEVIQSKQHKDWIKTDRDKFSADPSKFDQPGTFRNLEKFKEMPIADRQKFGPNILQPKGFDINKFIGTEMKSGNWKPTKTANTYDTGINRGVETEETYTPEQITKMAREFLETPDYKDKIVSEWDALSPAQQMDRAKEAKARTAAGEPITPLELLSEDHVRSRNFKQEEKTMGTSAHFAGWQKKKEAKDEVRWLLEGAAGLMEQNPLTTYVDDGTGQTKTNFLQNKKIGVFQISQDIPESTNMMGDVVPASSEMVLTENIVMDIVYDGFTPKIRTTRSQYEYDQGITHDPYSVVEDMFADLIEPYIVSNYRQADATGYLQAIMEMAQEDYKDEETGLSGYLEGGGYNPPAIFKSPGKDYGAERASEIENWDGW